MISDVVAGAGDGRMIQNIQKREEELQEMEQNKSILYRLTHHSCYLLLFISEGTSGLRYGRCHIVNKSRLPHCHPLKIVTDQLEFSSFFVHYTSKSSKFTRLRNMNNILRITTTSIFHVQTPMGGQFINFTLKFTSVTTLICRFECSTERSEIECHFDENAHTSK